jgi:hypothetical protein
MRDFVAILRQGLAGQAINHQGEERSAPYRGPEAKGIEPTALGLEVISENPTIVGASSRVRWDRLPTPCVNMPFFNPLSTVEQTSTFEDTATLDAHRQEGATPRPCCARAESEAEKS